MASSSFIIHCSGCNRSLKVGAKLVGKRVKCSKCGEAVSVPERDMAPVVAASTGNESRRRGLWAAALVLLALLALGPLVLWLGGLLDGPANNEKRRQPADEPGTIFYDLRGRPRPSAFVPYGALTESFLKTEAEGLRVRLPKERKNDSHWGLTLPLSIAGDFEITAAIEILDAEEPAPEPPCYGIGVQISLNETVRIGRLARADGVQAVTWDRWATVDGKRKFQSGASPCEAKTLRVRLKRQNAVVHLSWAADTDGGTFQEFYQCPFSDEVRDLRLEMTGRQGGKPLALDFRFIDLRIRRVFPNLP